MSRYLDVESYVKARKYIQCYTILALFTPNIGRIDQISPFLTIPRFSVEFAVIFNFSGQKA